MIAEKTRTSHCFKRGSTSTKYLSYFMADYTDKFPVMAKSPIKALSLCACNLRYLEIALRSDCLMPKVVFLGTIFWLLHNSQS